MKLWLISQQYNSGWDTYDSAVVVAPDEESARNVPVGSTGGLGPTWCPPEYVTAQYIGEAKEGLTDTIICASFNAG